MSEFPDFCKTCPDRGGENCALPTEKDVKQAEKRLARADFLNEFFKKVCLIGAAQFGAINTMQTLGQTEPSNGMIKAREMLDNQALAVEACVTLHRASN